MPWRLNVWFGYSAGLFGSAVIDEVYDTRKECEDRVKKILKSDYETDSGSEYHFYPKAAIAHMMIKEEELLDE